MPKYKSERDALLAKAFANLDAQRKKRKTAEEKREKQDAFYSSEAANAIALTTGAAGVAAGVAIGFTGGMRYCESTHFDATTEPAPSHLAARDLPAEGAFKKPFSEALFSSGHSELYLGGNRTLNILTHTEGNDVIMQLGLQVGDMAHRGRTYRINTDQPLVTVALTPNFTLSMTMPPQFNAYSLAQRMGRECRNYQHTTQMLDFVDELARQPAERVERGHYQVDTTPTLFAR